MKSWPSYIATSICDLLYSYIPIGSSYLRLFTNYSLVDYYNIISIALFNSYGGTVVYIYIAETLPSYFFIIVNQS